MPIKSRVRKVKFGENEREGEQCQKNSVYELNRLLPGHSVDERIEQDGTIDDGHSASWRSISLQKNLPTDRSVNKSL